MKIRLRPAVPDDLKQIVELEARADMAPYLYEWGLEKHKLHYSSPDYSYLIAVSEGQDWLGMVIFSGIGRPDRNIELVRVAVSEPGKGTGRFLIDAVQEFAFGELNAHRLWLDVFEDNSRARNLYQKSGFREEGLFLEAGKKRTGGRVSLVIMAMLNYEFETLNG